MTRKPRQTAKPAPIPPAKGQLGVSMTPKARKAKLAWLKARQARRARWRAKRWGVKGLGQRA